MAFRHSGEAAMSGNSAGHAPSLRGIQLTTEETSTERNDPPHGPVALDLRE